MKADKEVNKDIIGLKVKELPLLKSKYTELTSPPSTAKNGDNNDSAQKQPSPLSPSSPQDSVITPRDQDYSMWYNDVIYASDMVDQSPVRGCMVIKPWGMGVWDILRGALDERIRETGTSNAYFPLFIPQSFLSKEAEHVDGMNDGDYMNEK